ncbi:hypothetical protein J2Y69_002488 [Microbacterium resistens]|uniref:DUF7574 domain-containing protein n=1 Tax=Microbacterium resistens TaxID=156977 RepID=A0ABU1SE35_9MICO|nr:hypothetical protein [Microbacterium resistens]MDR6867880.1 hypothetical protein [Microbacterium resistens]
MGFSELGFTTVGDADLSEPNYSFDLIGAWKDADGAIYLGTDSGCSCPTPWEYYNELSDFTGPLTKEQAVEEATALWAEAGRYCPEDFATFTQQIRDC